jgi:hypothetical protein
VRRRNLKADLIGALLGLLMAAGGIPGLMAGPAAPPVALPGHFPTSPYAVGAIFAVMGAGFAGLMVVWAAKDLRIRPGPWLSASELCVPAERVKMPTSAIERVTEVRRKADKRLIAIQIEAPGRERLDLGLNSVGDLARLALALKVVVPEEKWSTAEL